MNQRPRIKLELRPSDKIIEGLGWISVFGIWILTLLNYFELPEIIPIHFNGRGEADGFGGKSNLLSLPIISTALFFGLTILNKKPHLFNYPSAITEENALQQYTNATRMLRALKLVIVVIFGLIVLRTIQNVNGTADGLGTWFLPVIMAMIFIPIIYYLIKATGKKNK
ncbi:DUF1648 domain-containing protein [Robiginitalea sp.]|jgi:uncharacterized membrane protein|nr:DUF1648 domain-containing protein [Robiginitalea sp.]